MVSDILYKDTTAKSALNDLYEKSRINITSDKFETLLQTGLSYTFDADYKYVFVCYATRYWIETEYSTQNMSEPIYSEKFGTNTLGVETLIYRDVKKNSVISFKGNAEKNINIYAIKE